MPDRRKKWRFLVLLGLLVLFWLAAEPGCLFRNRTGIPCPGCGMSRAWLAALGGDFSGAMGYHPMFWSVPIVVWLGWHKFQPFRRMWLNVALTAGLTGGLLLVYALRLSA